MDKMFLPISAARKKAETARDRDQVAQYTNYRNLWSTLQSVTRRKNKKVPGGAKELPQDTRNCQGSRRRYN